MADSRTKVRVQMHCIPPAPNLLVYFTAQDGKFHRALAGQLTSISLTGGDKGSQDKDIRSAKEYLLDYRSKNNRKKAGRSYDEWVIESLKGDEKAQAEYVQATIEENTGFSKAILIALRHVAEARGFKKFAEETNLNRETLYKTLSEDGNPTLDSLSKMLDVLGLDISVKPKKVS